VTVSWRLGWAVTGAILFVAALACDAAAPESSDSPSPVAAGETATPQPTFDAGVLLEEFPDGKPVNQVIADNSDDKRFLARASIKFRKLKGDDIGPVNIAFAQGQCTDCQTIAVAVQVIVYKRQPGASNIHPQNVALAANVGCTRCVTVARAIQYVIPVDDFDDVPDNVKRLVHRLDQELHFFEKMRSIDELTSDEASARLQRAVDEFTELHQYMVDLMTKKTGEDDEDPGAKATGERLRQSPSPSPSGAAPASPSSPSPSATPAATPTATP
jgi:hypothetical protein